MSKNSSGQGNNQSAKPIVQPGEDAEAIQNLTQRPPADPIESFTNDGAGDPQPPTTSQEPQPTHAGHFVAKEMSAAELTALVQQLAAGQQQMASMLSSLARNNPVFGRNDADQQSDVPRTTLDMPTDGSIDAMRRPDQRIEGLDMEMSRNMDHAQQMAFLEELVVINIHDTAEQGAENPVPLWVNGRGVAIPRGQDMAVRRKYVELLLRAKPEGIQTRITRGGDGEPRNHIDKTRSLKYPFSIVLDRNPRGPAWARKVRAEA